MKIVRVVFSPEAEKIYRYLNAKAPSSKVERMILKALNKKIELIKINKNYGNPIPKNLIPKEYKEKYGISNLFRVELPQFWRMLYTLTNNETEIEIIAFVLDIINHKEYNKKFSYG
jgi:mRNA-degrading endonuclease RelE of RelBE toxin-antitoxin system